MLKLKDKNKKLIAGLINYKDLCIESTLSTGDKKLSFSLPKEDKFYNFIEEECYIETKKAEFVIKARDVGIDYTRFDCVLNLETLEANIFDRFESVEQTITNSLNLAIVGTGWTVKDNTLKKKRTVRCTNKNALEIVQEIKKTYRVDMVFNTLKREIEIYEHLGEDKGTYFIDSLNLTALQVQSDSYKFATRIVAEGKDGLTFEDINNGKNYVENYQYSRKVKTIYWKDERYTIKENLLEDARAKLEELSKPFRSYSASILNLAELNPRYSSILDFKLGDAINLISKKNKIKDKQRIVKTIEWPQDHTKDSVELANATLKFEDIQKENQETTDTVNNITTDNGTVDGSTIDSITTKQIEDFEANVIKVAKLKAILAEIENLHVNKADIQNLNAVIARIGTLEATKASITELNAIHAIIQQIKASKADIADLNAAVAKVGILENKTAVLENALAGNLTADNFKTNAITAGSAVIAEGAIGSSQISSLSVNKLEAGDITTSKHKIVSADGTIEIVGNQILINRNNVNRVILGEYRKSDGTTDYGLLVRAKDGQTIMLDGNGVHNAGITDGAIDNNKVADNANISGNKLDINSVIREVNNNGTETIKGTKVTVGDKTLDVELSTQKNTITDHSKELSSQKASLTALDNALKFKVDEQVYRDSINTINNNISTTNSNLSKATTELKLLKGKVDLKVNKIDIDKTVKEIEDKIKVTTDKITTAESKFTQENNSIKASVQDLNSTTQSITTNVSNINRDLTSKINSNLDVAKNFATSKAIEALNSAKSYTNAEITTVNSKVHNLESGINILKDQIKSKVSQSDIDKSIENIEFGGRNLLTKQNLKDTFKLVGDPTFDYNHEDCKNGFYLVGDKSQKSAIRIPNVIDKNGEYTVSFEFKGSQNTQVGFKIDMCDIGSKWFGTTSDNTWKKVVHTVKVTNYSGVYNFIDFQDISWAYIFVRNLKVERGNKATDYTQAPEDLNQSITDSIKIVDSKISDVSSSITQLRDSVTTQINSINSKTHSIETTLGGKANKQEVTEVNNKVATIKASLDSITQRVSSTESKTNTLETNLNGKASKQDVTNVSNKVVSLENNLNGITNRVSSTESRINSLNGQVAGAVTKQEFTEFRQSSKDFELEIKNGGTNNLIQNGDFEGDFYSVWERWGNPSEISILGEEGSKYLKLNLNGEGQGVRQVINVEPHTTYTFTCYCENDPGVISIPQVANAGSYPGVEVKGNGVFSFTFTTQKNNIIFLYLGRGSGGTNGVTRIFWATLTKGNLATNSYIPNSNEINGSVIKANKKAITATYSNGTYTKMGYYGFQWYAPGMEYPYRALSYHEAVSINTDGSNNYIYRDIQLPARFDYADPKFIDITASLKGWYKYTGKNFSVENITVSTGKVYRSNGHTYAQVACRGCIRHDDTFKTEGLQVVATLHVTA